MNDPEVVALFATLAGYWPTSAPDPSDDVAVAAHLSVLDRYQPAEVIDAVRRLANDGREFCPGPGVIASMVRAARPAYPNAPALEPVCETDDEKVRGYLAEARSEMQRIKAKRSGVPADQIGVKS